MIAAVAILVLGGSNDFIHQPFEKYSRRMVQGWRVYVSPEAGLFPETEPALKKLDEQLKEITRLIPARALSTIRTVPFFFEANDPRFPCACYHTSPDWLRENGYIAQKARTVQISNPGNYKKWIELNQPYMTLHELAHAYHDIRFGFQNPLMANPYREAVASKKYDLVKHNLNKTLRAYALNDPMEYFAEATEAYFGRNDYFPFTRADLKEMDPGAYAMVEEAWGVGPGSRH